MENLNKDASFVFALYKKILPSDDETLNRLLISIQVRNSEIETFKPYFDKVQTALGDDYIDRLCNFVSQLEKNYTGSWANETERLAASTAFHLAIFACKQRHNENVLTIFMHLLKQGLSANNSFGSLTLLISYVDSLTREAKGKNHVSNYLQAMFSGKYSVVNPNSAVDLFPHLHYFRNHFASFTHMLYQRQQLDVDWFYSAILACPYYAHIASDEFLEQQAHRFDADFVVAIRQYLYSLIDRMLANLSVEHNKLRQLLGYFNYAGLESLQRGLACIEKNITSAEQLHVFSGHDYRHIINSFIAIDRLGNGENDRQLAQILATQKPSVLLLALPYAGYARDHILSALGWEKLIPLQRQLFKIAGSASNAVEVAGIKNCDDESCGVIDRKELEQIVQPLNHEQLDTYFNAINDSACAVKDSLFMVKAVMNLDRKKIEQHVSRDHQLAIKAYGLYPLKDFNELKLRYKKFHDIYKHTSRYGAERQTNTRAAVRVGLSNLAQSAGFADANRMEWEIELALAKTPVPIGKAQQIDDWSVKLVLNGIKPNIEITKKGKLLKSIPVKLRSNSRYVKFRQAQEDIRSQASRYRYSLENMMIDEEEISLQEFKKLHAIPVLTAMLSQLLIIDGAGKIGRCASNTMLVNSDQETLDISTPIKIAHVFHLYQASQLAQWQKVIVQQRIVQPFKQVFRELYVLTPAEAESETNSQRFAGHRVISTIAGKLLQTRNWKMKSEESLSGYKCFKQHDICAQVAFPNASNFLALTPTAILGDISFMRDQKPLALSSVAPIIFSEAMRDVDLLASVAQADTDHLLWSKEAAFSRAAFITNLFSDLGIDHVQCKDRHVHIKGHLADYRIHLGNAAIHMQPGNYLCVIPTSYKRDSLYLPFADRDDRMAEILSKIFLLLDDKNISDPSIREQLKI